MPRQHVYTGTPWEPELVVEIEIEVDAILGS